MDTAVYLLVAVVALLGASIEWKLGRTDRRIARVEQKVDLMLEHLDIRPAGPGLDRVGALLRDGKQVAAVKAYRRITGAGLLEAKEAVDRMAAAGDGRASAGQPAGKPVSPGGSQGR
ncbi:MULTISPECIES: hypothetical protein [Streptomyces]|uniref:hypothetical protein n=1 Tax=Streptomyces TaxID=1883 RepID=UPI000D1E8A3A|nr:MULTISPECIES: hypothetical protein [Streptomyces]